MADAHQSQGATLFIDDGSGSPTVFTQIGGVKDFSGPDGKATVIDKSDLSSTYKEKLMGLPDEGNIQFTLNFISGDAGQLAAIAARTARRRAQFKLTIPAGAQNSVADPAQSMLFYGYVLSFQEKGGVDKLVEATIDIAIDGQISRV
jgi:Lambda phage tail tube protein, TTP